MRKSFNITRNVILIIFCLFIFSSGQVNQILSSSDSTDKSEFSEETSFVCDISVEISSFIEEDLDENDKSLYKLNGIDPLGIKVYQTFFSPVYKNNEILPTVILIHQTNLPPPVFILA